MANEIGAMFWASQQTRATVAQLREIGFRTGQMALPGDFELATLQGADDVDGFPIHTLFGTYTGESYADIPTVQRTVGFVPPQTRAEREQRTVDIVDLAVRLGVKGVATHVGFIPDDTRSEDYIAVREMVRRIADKAAKHGMTFALETGQESAGSLLEFLLDVNRDNVGVNFDPANMILYGTGDPVEALEVIGQHVLTVHAKDGSWPSAAAPGSLGIEKPLGKGNVNFSSFLAVLAKFGYDHPLFIEREVEDRGEWVRDLAAGKKFLETLQMSV